MTTIKHFEDFAKHPKIELFENINALDGFLSAHPQAYLDGLGLEMLTPASSKTSVREHDGKEHDVIMLGSNSFLSLTTHPNVVKATMAACEKYGYGTGAVSLYAGITDLHRELERLVAELYGAEDAILFPCGYSGNVGVISSLCGPGDILINDAANHASIFDGCALSGGDIKIYLHGNMKHLEKILKQLPSSSKSRLIITDGVFSMDGDTAKLDEIIELARHYHARVMVDDAHGIGVVGKTGRGTAEKYDCIDSVDIHYGTLSKAPGGIGGYCAGDRKLIQYLRYYARTYFFSTSIPAPIIAGMIEVVKLILSDKAGRELLWENIHYLLKHLKALGFDTGHSESAIIPIIVGDEQKLGLMNNELRKKGVFTNVVTYPATRRKACRLRLNASSALTKEDMDKAIFILKEVGEQYGVIQG